jgi:hypothetical protein
MSALESTLVLGGLLVIVGAVAYLWMKQPSTPAVAGVQPVPLQPPTQPIPDPTSPGY